MVVAQGTISTVCGPRCRLCFLMLTILARDDDLNYKLRWSRNKYREDSRCTRRVKEEKKKREKG